MGHDVREQRSQKEGKKRIGGMGWDGTGRSFLDSGDFEIKFFGNLKMVHSMKKTA